MQGWFAALEQSAPVGMLKASFVAYPLVNAAHVIGIGLLFTSVVLMDLRLLGRFTDLPQALFIRLLRRCALLGFLCAAVSGAIMFSVRATEYAALPLFWAKMSLIVLAGCNVLAFAAIQRNRPADAPPSATGRGLAMLSILLWLAVLLCGRFLGYV